MAFSVVENPTEGYKIIKHSTPIPCIMRNHVFQNWCKQDCSNDSNVKIPSLHLHELKIE